MDLERAKEIVSAVNDRCFFKMELVEKVGSLKGVSLAEMLEAKRVVQDNNHDGEARQKVEGGSRSISMTPDDRLIAAAYVMEHYPVDTEAIVILPTTRLEAFSHEASTKGLAILPIKQDGAEEDED